jgi:hypothetical protein
VLESGIKARAADGRYDTLLRLARRSGTDSEAKVGLLLKHKYGRRWVIKAYLL